jgi:hypothetical protein
MRKEFATGSATAIKIAFFVFILRKVYIFGYFIFLSYFIHTPLSSSFIGFHTRDYQAILWRSAFFTHISTAIISLLLGPFLFSSRIRNANALLHRRLGKLYVLVVCLLASPTGMVMAASAIGGLYARLAFGIQSALWFAFTLKAFRFAVRKRFQAHRMSMICSYALGCGAITQRSLVHVFNAGFFLRWRFDNYVWSAWLGWTLNLTVAAVIILASRSEEPATGSDR